MISPTKSDLRTFMPFIHDQKMFNWLSKRRVTDTWQYLILPESDLTEDNKEGHDQYASGT